MTPAEEFELWKSWIGRRVKVTLTKDEDRSFDASREGILLKLEDDGEVDIRDDTGVTWYCWPALEMELSEGGDGMSTRPERPTHVRPQEPVQGGGIRDT